ncbi:MAG: 4Fe-4S dicluster domain-containing protein [Balneolaceae bacterium]|nr:MAG: 4Fe-4S dicluster domain-containing protein [Balneolaceae bacterium]
MALIITDDCINCGYCALECPNNAIYEPGSRWTMQEGTGVEGIIKRMNNEYVKANDRLDPLSEKYYFIVPDKCSECKGIFEEPQCLVVCPNPDSLVHHPWYRECENDLLIKQFKFR